MANYRESGFSNAAYHAYDAVWTLALGIERYFLMIDFISLSAIRIPVAMLSFWLAFKVIECVQNFLIFLWILENKIVVTILY